MRLQEERHNKQSVLYFFTIKIIKKHVNNLFKNEKYVYLQPQKGTMVW